MTNGVLLDPAAGTRVSRVSPNWRLALTLIFALAIYNAGLFVIAISPYCLRGYSDFSIFYTAGNIIKNGNASRLYDATMQWDVQKTFCDIPIRKGPLLFNHAPFEALLFLPLALVHYETAFMLWLTTNCIFLFIIAFLLRIYTKTWLPHWSLWPVVSIAFFPCFMVFAQGQDSLMTMFIYTGVFTFMRNNSPLAAGSCLSLALYKPQLVLPFVVIMLIQRRWRIVIGFVLGSSTLTGISVLLVGGSAVLGYVNFLLNFDALPVGLSAADPKIMSNLRGLIMAFVEPTKLSGISTLLVGGLSVVTLLAAARAMGNDLEGSFAMAVVATLFASYHLYEYDLALLLLPATLICARMRERHTISTNLFFVCTGMWFLSMLFLGIGPRSRALLSIILMLGVMISLWLSRENRSVESLPEKMSSSAIRP